MTDSTTGNTKMPAHVKIPMLLAFSLALLLSPLSVFCCLVGLFVGDRILLIGLVIGLLVVILFVGCRGLKDGWPWARQLLVIVSSLAFLGLLFLIGFLHFTGELGLDPQGTFIWLLAGPMLVFETIALMLSSKAAAPWFETSASGFLEEVMHTLGESD